FIVIARYHIERRIPERITPGRDVHSSHVRRWERVIPKVAAVKNGIDLVGPGDVPDLPHLQKRGSNEVVLSVSGIRPSVLSIGDEHESEHRHLPPSFIAVDLHIYCTTILVHRKLLAMLLGILAD